MKEKFLALVSQIEDIRKTAHEEHVKGFLNQILLFMMYQNL